MPEGLLENDLWAFYDPGRDLHPGQLFDFNSGQGERGICALPYIRLRDLKTIWFPVNLVDNLYVSNGMSAGNTVHEARVQALSEILERHVKNKVIAEAICLPQVPRGVLHRFPASMAVLADLERHGYHLRVADASLGGRYPVICVVLINPVDGSVLASFGAHPCFETALERTVTELLQGRSLDQINDFHPPTFDQTLVADPHNLEEHFVNSTGVLSYDFFRQDADYDFVDWDHDVSNDEACSYLCDLIHSLGFDIYVADYNYLNVYACRIIVPGMSEIYPVDDLLWNNNNEGALFREDILSLKNRSPLQWQDILERLEEGGYNDMQKVAEFIGIIPDAGTEWAGLRIGGLKGMLSLALKDYKQARQWAQWCLQMDHPDRDYTRHYRCLLALLDIALDEDRDYASFQPSLELMYGRESVQAGLDLIAGKINFHGLHSPGLGLDGFSAHKRLLEAYRKLHKAKERNA